MLEPESVIDRWRPAAAFRLTRENPELSLHRKREARSTLFLCTLLLENQSGLEKDPATALKPLLIITVGQLNGHGQAMIFLHASQPFFDRIFHK